MENAFEKKKRKQLEPFEIMNEEVKSRKCLISLIYCLFIFLPSGMLYKCIIN